MSIVSFPAAASPLTASDGSLANPTSCPPSEPCRRSFAVCSSTAWKPLSVAGTSVSSATWSRSPRSPRSPNGCARCGKALSSSTPSRPSAAPSACWHISPATRPHGDRQLEARRRRRRSCSVLALSRQISIGDFRRQIRPSALVIREQKQWISSPPWCASRQYRIYSDNARQRIDALVALAFCRRWQAAPPHRHRRSRAQAYDSLVALREAGSGSRGCGARLDAVFSKRTPTSSGVVPCTGWGVPLRS